MARNGEPRLINGVWFFADGTHIRAVSGGADPDPKKTKPKADPDPDPDDDPDPDPDDDPDPDPDDDPDEGDPAEQKARADRAEKALKRERDLHKGTKKKLNALRKSTREDPKSTKKPAKKGEDDEVDVEAIRKEAADAAREEERAKSNKQLVRSTVRAIAAEKLQDPKDAERLLDLDEFEVDEDGDIDEDEISEAIDELVEKKPYLKKDPEKKRPGDDWDGGARGKRTKEDPNVQPGLGRLRNAYSNSSKKKKKAG